MALERMNGTYLVSNLGNEYVVNVVLVFTSIEDDFEIFDPIG